MPLPCPEPPKSISHEHVQFFRAGFKDGSTESKPFSPGLKWSGLEKQAYATGFDLGIDALVGTLVSN